MIDHCAVASHEFRDSTRETGPLTEAQIGLEDRRLTVAARQNQVARIGGAAGGDEEQVNGSGQDATVPDLDKRAVFEAGRIQRGHRVLAEIGVAPHLARAPRLERFPQTPSLHSSRRCREQRRIAPIDEDQPRTTQVREGGRCQFLGRERAGLGVQRLQERRQVGVLPFLVPGGGESQRVKAVARDLAEIAEHGKWTDRRRHRFTPSPLPPRARRSPAARVRAPAPCRPSARSARCTSHARSPAQRN